MHRREFLIISGTLLGTGCSARQASGPRNPPEPQSQGPPSTETPSSSLNSIYQGLNSIYREVRRKLSQVVFEPTTSQQIRSLHRRLDGVQQEVSELKSQHTFSGANTELPDIVELHRILIQSYHGLYLIWERLQTQYERIHTDAFNSSFEPAVSVVSKFRDSVLSADKLSQDIEEYPAALYMDQDSVSRSVPTIKPIGNHARVHDEVIKSVVGLRSLIKTLEDRSQDEVVSLLDQIQTNSDRMRSIVRDLSSPGSFELSQDTLLCLLSALSESSQQLRSSIETEELADVNPNEAVQLLTRCEPSQPT